MLPELVSEKGDLLSQLNGIEQGIERLELPGRGLVELAGRHQTLKSGGGPIIALDHSGSMAFFRDEFSNRLEEVHQEPLLLIELLQSSVGLPGAIAVVANRISDRGPVPLFNKGLVVLAIRAAASEADPLILAVANDELVDEL